MSPYEVYLKLDQIIKIDLANFNDAQYGKGKLKDLRSSYMRSLLEQYQCSGLMLFNDVMEIPAQQEGELHAVWYRLMNESTVHFHKDCAGTKISFAVPVWGMALYR